MGEPKFIFPDGEIENSNSLDLDTAEGLLDGNPSEIPPTDQSPNHPNAPPEDLTLAMIAVFVGVMLLSLLLGFLNG